MYSHIGISILNAHCRKNNISLYLDATGRVVKKPEWVTKRILLYVLTLPGAGRDKSPLPVAQLVSEAHSKPKLAHWLDEVFHHLKK